MVILLSGYSSIGKTLMAQSLMEKYHMPYLSMDHLKMGLYRGDVNCEFSPEDDDYYIATKLWPIMEGMIKTVIENDQQMIVEGSFLFPDLISTLETPFKSKIIQVYFGFSERYLHNNFESHIIRNQSIIEKRFYEEDRSIETFIQGNRRIKEAVIEAGYPYFEIDENYEVEILEIYDFIEKQMHL